MSRPVNPGVIEALEAAVEHATRTGDTSGLRVIGHGEVSVVLALDHGPEALACKRLVPFRSRELADEAAETIVIYIDELRRCGVDVIDTETPIIERSDGRSRWFIVYCVQPMMAPECLGPAFLRDMDAAAVTLHITRIFELLRTSVSSRLAPDGQLSNWAFDGSRLLYLDVGTPFLRDPSGRSLFDFSQQTRALPWPIRVVSDRFLIERILDNYHSLRGQALDFLGNLIKEGLGELMVPLIPLANRVLGIEPAITERDVRAHYRGDARVYRLIQASRRADRWFKQSILRKPYGFLIPPRIQRYD